MEKIKHIAAIILLFTVQTAFSFCEIIPQNIDEARELLEENLIDSICFDAAEILFLSPVNPIDEGWFRLESVGFDLSEEDFPTTNELQKIAETGGDLAGLFRKYPALSEFENFISIPKSSSKPSPIKSSLSVSARRTDGDNEQYYSVSSTNRFADNFLISAQIREQKEMPYLENRSLIANFKKNDFLARINVGNLVSPSNELLFGRYATFSQARKNENILYGSKGGYNGGILQTGTKQAAALGYFHAKPDEYLAGGGFFIQPQNTQSAPDFRLEVISIHGEKNLSSVVRKENLLQVKGEFVNLGISISNAFALNSNKSSLLLKYEKSLRDTRILSQIWFMEEGFDSPFSSLIARNDTTKHQKIGTQYSVRGKNNTQRFWVSAKYLLNGDLGTAQIWGSYYFPEITGLGYRSNFSLKSDTTKLKQSHTIFHGKKFAKYFKTNISAAISFYETAWKQSVFNAGIDGFLPNNQQIHLGFSEKLRKEKSAQETIYLSYKSLSSRRNTKSLALDIPLYENVKGLRIYGEMRFAFPASDSYCL